MAGAWRLWVVWVMSHAEASSASGCRVQNSGCSARDAQLHPSLKSHPADTDGSGDVENLPVTVKAGTMGMSHQEGGGRPMQAVRQQGAISCPLAALCATSCFHILPTLFTMTILTLPSYDHYSALYLLLIYRISHMYICHTYLPHGHASRATSG